MTVRDLSDLFTDPDFQQVAVYSLDHEKVVYSGDIREIAFGIYGDREIESIDTLFEKTDTLTINI